MGLNGEVKKVGSVLGVGPPCCLRRSQPSVARPVRAQRVGDRRWRLTRQPLPLLVKPEGATPGRTTERLPEKGELACPVAKEPSLS
ncbi:MAG: hypothetical protein KatS3mg111_1763 [Pirellulaceae bacterium]|nr:MAG: hypothetical protein KatS3mg111_1763 [Pirellulaceae bacterium]